MYNGSKAIFPIIVEPLSETEVLRVNLSYRFILPVVGENLLTILIGLVFSSIISVISASALAAIGMANTVMALVVSVFSVVTIGASALVSRQVGAHENHQAAQTVEQSTMLGLALSVLITAAAMALAGPIMHVVMPSAEATMYAEAVRYFRILMLSLPAYILNLVLSAVCRATGDSRNPMLVAVLLNLSQLAFGWLFIIVLHMEEIGAALAYVCCRTVGAVLIALLLIRDHRLFTIDVRNILRPQVAVVRRILNIGVPACIESVFVQVGYLLANSMAIALGSFEAGVYQILVTINTFTALPQNVTLTVTMPVTGQLLGAKNPAGARRAGNAIWLCSLAFTFALCGAVMLFGKPFAGVYSSDPATIAATAGFAWLLLVLNIPASSINSVDPQLRAGGDVRYVMLVTLSAVWLIRLPLTYLFCFVWHWGVPGIFLGNSISLYYRAIMGLLRRRGDKWLTRKI